MGAYHRAPAPAVEEQVLAQHVLRADAGSLSGHGQDGGVRVLLAQHRGGSLELFLRELLRAGKNDRAGGLDLVVVEFAEVLQFYSKRYRQG